MIGVHLRGEQIKMLPGHVVTTGATREYLDPEIMRMHVPARLWTYLDGVLPSPEDIVQAASERLRELGHDVELKAIPEDEEEKPTPSLRLA